MRRVLINIDETDYAQATAQAKSDGLSFSALMRTLIKKYLRKPLDKKISK
jgi:hypothetical protein